MSGALMRSLSFAVVYLAWLTADGVTHQGSEGPTSANAARSAAFRWASMCRVRLAADDAFEANRTSAATAEPLVTERPDPE